MSPLIIINYSNRGLKFVQKNDFPSDDDNDSHRDRACAPRRGSAKCAAARFVRHLCWVRVFSIMF